MAWRGSKLGGCGCNGFRRLAAPDVTGACSATRHVTLFLGSEHLPLSRASGAQCRTPRPSAGSSMTRVPRRGLVAGGCKPGRRCPLGEFGQGLTTKWVKQADGSRRPERTASSGRILGGPMDLRRRGRAPAGRKPSFTRRPEACGSGSRSHSLLPGPPQPWRGRSPATESANPCDANHRRPRLFGLS